MWLSRSFLLRVFPYYIIFSTFAFFLTSGGWYWITYLFIQMPILFIGYAMAYVSLDTNKNSYIYLSRKLLVMTLLLQLIILSFNFGDGGDSGHAGNFLQRILGFADENANPRTIIRPWFSSEIILYLHAFYSVLIARLFYSAKKEVQS